MIRPLHALALAALLLAGGACDAPAPEVTGAAAPGAAEAPEGMAHIPAGTYTVGSGEDNEGPRRQLQLDGFYMDRLPVTEAEFLAFTRDPAYAELLGRQPARRKAVADPTSMPAVNLSQQEAEAYAAWLGRRLPTEAEWEAAARGLAGRLYPWGDDWRDDAVDMAARGPVPVGQSTSGATPEGIEDLVGNVFHWTASYTRAGQQMGGPDHSGPRLYVVKAGGLPRMGRYNRATFRTAYAPEVSSEYIGFRTVLPQDPEADPNLAAAVEVSDLGQATSNTEEALRQFLMYPRMVDRVPPPVIREQIARVQPGMVAADVGSGTGVLTWRLAERVGPTGRVYAVDIDQSVYDFVTAWAAQEGLDQVEAIRSRPADIEVPEGSSDVVFLMGTLHCLTPEIWDAFVESCRRALKPGGLLVIWDDNNRYPIVRERAPGLLDAGFELVEVAGIFDAPGVEPRPSRGDPGELELILRKGAE